MTGAELKSVTPNDAACSPDEWSPGLHIEFKTLNTRSVRRAKTWREVMPVCLSHNLRDGNTAHRHRHPIDAERRHLNDVLRGPSSLDAAVGLVVNTFDALGIKPLRHDAIVGIEMVVQPPEGCDSLEFWAAVLDWVDMRFQHVASFVVHRDQRRPHGHMLALAVRDGELSGWKMTSGPNRYQRQIEAVEHHLRDRLGLRLPTRARKPGALETLALSAGKGAKTHAAAARSDAALMQRSRSKAVRDVGGGCVGGGHSSCCVDRLPSTASIAQFRALAEVVANWAAAHGAINTLGRGACDSGQVGRGDFPAGRDVGTCAAPPRTGLDGCRPGRHVDRQSPPERATPIARHRPLRSSRWMHPVPFHGAHGGRTNSIAIRPSRRAVAQERHEAKSKA